MNRAYEYGDMAPSEIIKTYDTNSKYRSLVDQLASDAFSGKLNLLFR